VGIIQQHISVINDILNDLNIYGGCYRQDFALVICREDIIYDLLMIYLSSLSRLAWASYNIARQRMDIHIPIREFTFLAIVRAGAGGGGRVRFSSGVFYSDDMNWYCTDLRGKLCVHLRNLLL
jgi:hypothetical protein